MDICPIAKQESYIKSVPCKSAPMIDISGTRKYFDMSTAYGK